MPVPTRFVSFLVRAVRRLNRWRKTIADAAAAPDVVGVTGVRVADVGVARSVAAETAADVRLAEASRSRQRADVTSVAAARAKHADPARTADLVKRALPARIVRRGVIVLRVPTVPPARIADRVKDAHRARSAPRSEIALRA